MSQEQSQVDQQTQTESTATEPLDPQESMFAGRRRPARVSLDDLEEVLSRCCTCCLQSREQPVDCPSCMLSRGRPRRGRPRGRGGRRSCRGSPRLVPYVHLEDQRGEIAARVPADAPIGQGAARVAARIPAAAPVGQGRPRRGQRGRGTAARSRDTSTNEEILDVVN